MNSIAVFCGASGGFNDEYAAAAYAAGQAIARMGLHLVYGGAKVGLMGRVADGALSEGGRVTGVLPAFLKTRELMHTGLTELIIVETMHERKLRMHELSEGIITLPGGFGTMEELFEMLTWSQLGLHRKPIGLLNTLGFYDRLNDFVQGMIREGFLRETDAERLLIHGDAAALIGMMHNYEPPAVPKWLTEETT